MSQSHEINALLNETRVFPPSPEWRAGARISDPAVYEEAARDPEAFWARFASELEWMAPWSRVVEWKPPHAKWFVPERQRELRRSAHPHGAAQQGGDHLGR
jgi:acetyl-CoA synthetase